jgi:hypothetical protein
MFIAAPARGNATVAEPSDFPKNFLTCSCFVHIVAPSISRPRASEIMRAAELDFVTGFGTERCEKARPPKPPLAGPAPHSAKNRLALATEFE